jgi:integrase
VRYTVDGKGGLVREVALPSHLSERLEERRREKPKTVTDRGVRYTQHYDLGGGLTWGRSFSAASKRVLGWSTGGHGLRHHYAQGRVDDLQREGHAYSDALEIVSQEMGHFRPDITAVYLR